jgi:hypothetical protein
MFKKNPTTNKKIKIFQPLNKLSARLVIILKFAMISKPLRTIKE